MTWRLVASGLAVLAILVASSLPGSAAHVKHSAGVKQCKTDTDCKPGFHCAGLLNPNYTGTCIKATW